jgi:Protein of unknown function (DUF2934)
MSRTVTPSQTPTQAPPTQQMNQLKVPHDKVAQRAYEKWLKRGKPCTNGEQDWYEAEKELFTEMGRGQMPGQQQRR